MVNAHVDIAQGLDGEQVVLARFDLDEATLAACAHAVRGSAARFRPAELSVDQVLELRELTALTDALADLALEPGMRTIVLRPARLNALRDAVAHFVEERDEAEWLREEDREPLARVRALLPGLQELSADAVRTALSGIPSHR